MYPLILRIKMFTLNRDRNSLNETNFKSVDLSSNKVLVHEHFTRKDKGTKDRKDYGKINDIFTM